MYLLKIAKYLLLSIYMICGLMLAVFAIPQSGLKALTVLTGSMKPTISPGAMVFVRRVPNRDLKIGDIITYINPRNTKQTITHRIVETKIDQGLQAFVTKGDANQVADQQILGGNVVGRVEWYVPVLGQLISYVKTPLGLLLLLGLPAILIIFDEIVILRRTLGMSEIMPEGKPEISQPVTPLKAQITTAIALESPKSRRGMDGIMRVAILVLLASACLGNTRAQLISNPVRLTNNIITVQNKANHLLINRLYLGGVASPTCPTGSTIINLGTTGQASVNQINLVLTCNTSILSSNNITIININSQSASSGSTNSSGDAIGGQASNTNSTTTNVGVNNGSGHSLTKPWVELHNPTNSTITLTNWRLRDLASTLVDSLSWGSDTSQLNPSIGGVIMGSLLSRQAPSYDTDTASDWFVSP